MKKSKEERAADAAWKRAYKAQAVLENAGVTILMKALCPKCRKLLVRLAEADAANPVARMVIDAGKKGKK